MIKPQPKPDKAIKLTGQKKKDIQAQVSKRDSYRCIICHEYTEAPPHHINEKGQGGGDVENNMCVICNDCHTIYHHGQSKLMLIEKLLENWKSKTIIKYFLLGYIRHIGR